MAMNPNPKQSHGSANRRVDTRMSGKGLISSPPSFARGLNLPSDPPIWAKSVMVAGIDLPPITKEHFQLLAAIKSPMLQQLRAAANMAGRSRAEIILALKRHAPVSEAEQLDFVYILTQSAHSVAAMLRAPAKVRRKSVRLAILHPSQMSLLHREINSRVSDFALEPSNKSILWQAL